MNNKDRNELIIINLTLLFILLLYIIAFHKERTEKEIIKAKFEQHIKDDSLKIKK